MHVDIRYVIQCWTVSKSAKNWDQTIEKRRDPYGHFKTFVKLPKKYYEALKFFKISPTSLKEHNV